MKTKRILFLILIFLFSFWGCKTKEFPESITSELTDEHFRIKGTKLFVIKPKDFTYYEDVNVFRYNDSVFIHCSYIPSNFLQCLRTNKFDFFHNNDYEIISRQDFVINDNSGVFFKLKEKNSYWLYFMFGDSLVENRIVASFPIGSSFQETVFDFVQKSYYKQDYNINPLENAQFNIDLSEIGFKFATLSMNQFTFAENNFEKYLSKNERPNFISIAQLPPVTDSTEFEKTAIVMLQNMQNQGIIIKQILSEKYILINSNNAYKIIFKGEIENKEFYLYMVVTGNSNIQLQFTAVLYHNGEELLSKFDKTINSLILK